MEDSVIQLKRSPVNGTFELTGRCNLNCEMCYVHISDKRIKELGYHERSTNEWIDMAKQVFDAGTFKLLITGGEPMIREDFCEIYEAIAKMGFYITLYTNATLITSKIINVLKKYPPHIIGVTIYGVTPDTYKKVCGSGRAYYHMLDGLEKLMKLPSHIELRTTIIKDNLHEAKKIEKFIKRFGDRVTFNINHIVFKSGRNSIANIQNHRLLPEQSAKFYCDRFINLIEEYKDDQEKLNELHLNQKKGQNNSVDKDFIKHGPYGCNAGYNDYTISWNGHLLPCSLFDKYYTNPFEEGFINSWNRLEDVMPKSVIPEKCQKCSVEQFCGVCVASRYCETGKIDGIPQYFCQQAKAYEKFFKK
ncbi:MAG: radical SAM protein [Thomasclavelia sp.]